MARDTWRDPEGFGRGVEVEPRVWSAVGPDGEDHALACDFIIESGLLPCSCDATRGRFGVDHQGYRTYWFQRWLRWQKARSVAYARLQPMPWPITGPDGDPWIDGVDFN